MSNKENDEVPLSTVIAALVVAAIAMIAFLLPVPAESVDPVDDLIIEPITHVEEAHAMGVEEQKVETSASVQVIRALVTGYNTVPEQTDATPCIAATGDDICGRTDVVACPTAYPLGTQVEIDGSRYVCLDRTAAKYNGRWDISCDKDTACPHRVHGYKEVHIITGLTH